VFEPGLLLLLLVWTWRVWRLRRESLRRAGDPVEVQGRSRPWGWPEAPPPMRRVEDPHTSSLLLRAGRAPAEIAGCLFGGALLLFFALTLFRALFGDDPAAPTFARLGAVFGLFGWALLHSHSRLVRIELAADSVTFYSRYALFLYKRARLEGASARRALFEVEVPGLHELSPRQRRVETRLLVKRRFPGLRLFLDYELREAEFILRGLRDWQASLGGTPAA